MPIFKRGEMPTNVEPPKFAVDTSVAVAALESGHPAHERCRRRVIQTSAGLSGHAAFETFSVLTRMPGLSRLDPPVAIEVLEIDFPQRCWLSPEQSADLLGRCGSVGIVGGAVYDALVGEAARVNECTLLTRDRRAQRTYDLLGVIYEFLD